MKFPEWLPVFGDVTVRNKDCPRETAEQITFVSRIRKQYPATYGKLLVHIENEGKRSSGQAYYAKAKGLTKGASDILIPSKMAFVCEMKRADHTLCSWSDGQLEYLEAAQKEGAFVCVALGADGATAAFEQWLRVK